uniref:PPC domain-containing protein n=1 Tax=Candidatus Electronema sp. JC TaxID=3401570 RepID=UPI003B434128
LPNSGSATWYISVYGFAAGSYNLKATLSGSTPPPSTITTLTSGQAVSGSAGQNEWKKYKITSSSSDTQLKVDMTGLSADVDLYVQKGAEPTSSSYLCRPYSDGTTSESCTLPNSGSATWYISVYGFAAGSYNLKATLSAGTSAGAFVFPFQERNNVWQICQGYNSSPTHTGTLIHSFDFAYGTGNLGNTACWGNPSGSENQIVVAPAAGMIAWIGNNYPDITCLTLQNTISNGHGSNIASVKLGHMKSDATRVISGSVSQGTPIGILCGPNGCAGDGGYAHVHISAYTSTDCGNAQWDTSVPLGTVFGGSYDFSSNGTVRQWFTTEIPAQ